MSLSDAAKQLTWIRNLYNELNFKVHGIELHVDNQGAMFTAQNDGDNKRMKHIDIKYHHVRQVIEDGIIKLLYIPTNEQQADILTKNLTHVTFTKLRSLIGVQISQRGGVSN
jgi:hypothetical protein